MNCDRTRNMLREDTKKDLRDKERKGRRKLGYAETDETREKQPKQLDFLLDHVLKIFTAACSLLYYIIHFVCFFLFQKPF